MSRYYPKEFAGATPAAQIEYLQSLLAIQKAEIDTLHLSLEARKNQHQVHVDRLIAENTRLLRELEVAYSDKPKSWFRRMFDTP